MSLPNVELHIDELVLYGFPRTDRYEILAAVSRELTRLLAEQSLPLETARYSDVPHLDAGSFTVASGAGSDVIGAQIAQAVHGGLSP